MNSPWVPVLGFLVIVLTCAFAWWKGEASERYGALLILTIDIISDIAIALSYPQAPQFLLFALDLALAVGLLLIALRYGSLWLGSAMLLQAIALCTHSLIFGDEGPAPAEWMILNNVLSLLVLACIVAGTVGSWRTRRRLALRTEPAPFLRADEALT